MRREMSDLIAQVAQSQLDLSSQLSLHLFQIRARLNKAGVRREIGSLPRHRTKVAVRVYEAWRVGQGTPFHSLPLAGERQMDADVIIGTFLQTVHRIEKPRSRNHDFRRTRNAIV